MSADDNDNNDAVFVSQIHGACPPLSYSSSRPIQRIRSYPRTSRTKKRRIYSLSSALFAAYYAMAMIMSLLLPPPYDNNRDFVLRIGVRRLGLVVISAGFAAGAATMMMMTTAVAGAGAGAGAGTW